METAIEPSDVKPVLVAALQPIKETAIRNLTGLVHTGGDLKLPGQRHIEDVLLTEEGKSSTRASAFLKLWRKFAPQGIWIEFGHVLWRGGTRRSGKGKKWGDVIPRPFFRPAIDAQRKTTETLIEEGIKKLIERFTTQY